MERATAPQIRQSLVLADSLKNAGIRFVPMPVFDEEDATTLFAEMDRRLSAILASCPDD